MEKKLTSSKLPFLAQLETYAQKGWISEKVRANLKQFYETYHASLEEHGLSSDKEERLFETFLELTKEQSLHPFTFQPYHQQIRKPFDYYAFGVDFLRPLVDKQKSSVLGLEYAEEIVKHIGTSHNVILLANHQTEGDPQAISVLLEESYPDLGREMIFVAGERVITDPLAIPFSMGRNLLCIYSKRYIDHPPELKEKKQLHNQRTMQLMSQLLSEGGKCIYVAPSGGRDRRGADGTVEVAPFDPQSIEMFYLMAKKSSHPTFFYPLTLLTYDLLPPPETIQIELGEQRSTKRGDIHLAFGAVIDMENYPGSEHPNKHDRRKARAEWIWSQVNADYRRIKNRRRIP